MQKRIDEPNCVTEIGSFQSDYVAHGRTSVRCRPSHAVTQWPYLLESKFVDLRVCYVITRTVRGTSGEILEILESSSVDTCV